MEVCPTRESCLHRILLCSYLKLCTSQPTISPGQEKYQKCVGQASNRLGRGFTRLCRRVRENRAMCVFVMLDIQLHQQRDYFKSQTSRKFSKMILRSRMSDFNRSTLPTLLFWLKLCHKFEIHSVFHCGRTVVFSCILHEAFPITSNARDLVHHAHTVYLAKLIFTCLSQRNVLNCLNRKITRLNSHIPAL